MEIFHSPRTGIRERDSKFRFRQQLSTFKFQRTTSDPHHTHVDSTSSGLGAPSSGQPEKRLRWTPIVSDPEAQLICSTCIQSYSRRTQVHPMERLPLLFSELITILRMIGLNPQAPCQDFLSAVLVNLIIMMVSPDKRKRRSICWT